MVERISKKYGISETTAYAWWRGGDPIGTRAGRISYKPDLLYVLGALLGDGYAYHWRGNFQVSIVGEMDFVEKFARKLSVCTGRRVGYYKPSGKR